MAYSDRSILKDVHGKPIPQYYNPELDRFEPIQSKNRTLSVLICDSSGSEIPISQQVQEIVQALNNLVEVVTNGV